MRIIFLFVCWLIFMPSSFAAVEPVEDMAQYAPVDRTLTGPRVGLSYITGGAFDELKSFYGVGAETISQLGWLHEFVIRDTSGPYVHLAQVELLISGLEAHVGLPSVSALYLLRNPSNIDFGVGAHFGAFGTGIAFNLGKAFDFGTQRIPVQLLLKEYGNGSEISVTVGLLNR